MPDPRLTWLSSALRRDVAIQPLLPTQNSGEPVVLAPAEREELERRARSRSLATEVVKRAKVILMLAAGHSYSEVSEKLS